jgi:hypothetical protein
MFFILGLVAWGAAAAERRWDFSDVPEGQMPPGFRSVLTGHGAPGKWQVVLDDVPPLLPMISQPARAVTKQAVLAQLSADPTDDRYPLLLFENELFGDFTLTTRFKLVSGRVEQMAGVAFRVQDEKNYYYVRASGLGGTFSLFKFINGELTRPIASRAAITNGVWRELSVECLGNRVTCSLDGQPLIQGTMENVRPTGKIGFWTKSDAVSYFGATKIVFTPLEAPAQVLLRAALKRHPSLLGLKLYVLGADRHSTRVVASKDESEVGQPGGKAELAVINDAIVYYGKEKDHVAVILPLRDRNGDGVAAVRVVMRTFRGQSEANAVARATPIVRELQAHVHNLTDLVE